MSDQVCLVTGVGPGTGAALARRFVPGGYGVDLLAREASGLESLASELARSASFPGGEVYA